jgi:uncharacterized protein (TIGR03435 family)
MNRSFNAPSRIFLIAVATLFVSLPGSVGQAPGDDLPFEVASIRKAGASGSDSSVQSDPAILSLRSFSLQRLLLGAYTLKPYQLIGPKWMDSDRFDVFARFPPQANRDRIPAMLRKLIVERFGIQSHEEKRMLPGFNLAQDGKTLKLRPPVTESNSLSRYTPGRLELLGMTMTQLADQLTGLVGRPVFDRTGLTGSYSGVVKWSDSMTPLAADDSDSGLSGSGPEFSTALKEQLGLRLASAKVAVTVLVIDRVNRQPSEN